MKNFEVLLTTLQELEREDMEWSLIDDGFSVTFYRGWYKVFEIDREGSFGLYDFSDNNSKQDEQIFYFLKTPTDTWFDGDKRETKGTIFDWLDEHNFTIEEFIKAFPSMPESKRE